MRHPNKPQPTDAEFEELKRQRDEKFQVWLAKMCAREFPQ